jgi:hypothetical protein
MIKWLDRRLVKFGEWLIAAGRGVPYAWWNWRNPPYRTQAVIAQLPSRLAPRTLYIVEEDGLLEQAAMLCPCGCGRTLHMNLLPDERPCWKVTRHPDGTSTLHPSVWRQKDCGSHFWLRKGRILWAAADR